MDGTSLADDEAGGPVPELPTIPGGLGQMASSVESILAKLDRIDLVAIGPSDFAEYMGVRDSPNTNAPMRGKFLELARRVKAGWQE